MVTASQRDLANSHWHKNLQTTREVDNTYDLYAFAVVQSKVSMFQFLFLYKYQI